MAKQLQCSWLGMEGCPFSVTADSENEVLKHQSEHTQDIHNMAMSEDDLNNAKNKIQNL